VCNLRQILLNLISMNFKQLYFSIFIIIFYLSPDLYSSDSIFTKNAEISEGQRVRAEIYPFAKSILQDQSLRNVDLRLFDNGKEVKNLKLTNQFQETRKNISLLVLIDLASFSLERDSALLNEIGLSLDSISEAIEGEDSQFALMSFDDKCYLNQNFTSEKKIFGSNIFNLDFSYHSRIDSAFSAKIINPKSILEQVENEIICLLITKTDEKIFSKNEIISELIESNIELITCHLSEYINSDLKEISEDTEGEYIRIDIWQSSFSDFDGLILTYLKNIKPSIISFDAGRDCENIHNCIIELKGQDATGIFSYEFPDSLMPRLEILPKNKDFFSIIPHMIIPNNSDSVDFVLTADNYDITITDIRLSNDYSGVFELRGGIDSVDSNPILIKKGNFHQLRLIYRPQDSAIVFTRILIESSDCFNSDIKITGGFPNKPPIENTVEILKPNCGEKLIAGQTFDVEWTGLLKEDVIQLEYSLDNQETWQELAKNTSNLNYPWKVPDYVSSECFVRAIQLWPNNIGRTFDFPHFGPDSAYRVNTAQFSPGGDFFVTAAEDGFVRIWDPNLQLLVDSLSGHTAEVIYAEFSPNSKMILSCALDGKVILWNSDKESTDFGEIIRIYEGVGSRVYSAKFSPDNKKILAGGNNKKLIIWSTEKNEILHEKNVTETRITWVDYSPDSSYYAFCGNQGFARMYDTKTDELVREFDTRSGVAPQKYVVHINFSPDSKLLSTINDLKKEVRLWDVETGDSVATFLQPPYLRTDFKELDVPVYTSFVYDESGNKFMISSGNRESIKWNLDENSTEWQFTDSIESFKEHEMKVTSVEFNFDGFQVLTASWDGYAKVWNLKDRALQSDVSDCAFSIVRSEVSATDISLGENILGFPSVTKIKKHIINKSGAQFPIFHMIVTGANREEFKILNHPESFLMESDDSLDLEIMFTPNKLGNRKAIVEIAHFQDTISFELTAESVNPDFSIENKFLLFDTTELGESKLLPMSSLWENTGFEDVLVDSVKITSGSPNPFKLLTNIEDTTLTLQDIFESKLRFDPDSVGFYNAALRIYSESHSPFDKILLVANSVKPRIDSLTMSIKSFEGDVGEKVRTNLELKDISNLGIHDNIEGISFKISFNYSMLEPLFDYEKSELNGTIRTLYLSRAFPDSVRNGQVENIILEKLEFFVALGNDTETILEISDIKPLGKGKIALKTEDGNFSLTGNAHDNGKRLLYDLGLSSFSYYPNPSENTSILKFTMSEYLKVNITLSDAKGAFISLIANDYFDKGEYEINLETEKLAQGTYYCTIETALGKTTKKIIISGK
jgi:WD40 repeat protein